MAAQEASPPVAQDKPVKQSAEVKDEAQKVHTSVL